MLGTNIGAYITTKFALQRTPSGAGQGGNVGATDGAEIDRTSKRPLHISAKLAVGYKTTLASGNTLAITVQPRASEDGNTYEDFGDPEVVTVTGLGGGPQQTGMVEVDVNLIGAPAYIQARVTPVLSASGVDTAEVFGVWILGGGETIPPTESDA
jgi:hypothetical protein